MILYNMRYRGPLEYDKFVLNVLQYHNAINDILINEFDGPEAELVTMQENVDALYDNVVGKVDPNPLLSIIGLSEGIYYNMLDCKEV